MLRFGINKHPKCDKLYRVAEIKWSVRLDKNYYFFSSIETRLFWIERRLPTTRWHWTVGLSNDIV